MPKNKVNNNIKLKSGGGVINDAADGLSVDTGTTDGKIVAMTTGDKLPAVDGSNLTNVEVNSSVELIPSDTLRTSADAITTAVVGKTPIKKKEILLGDCGGTIRIKFDLRCNNGVGISYGRIYRNGVACGTQQETSSTSMSTKSEDIGGFSKGDLIQLYLYGNNDSTETKASNLRLYYNKQPKAVNNTVNLN